MNESGHRLTTQATLEVLRLIPGAPNLLPSLESFCQACINTDGQNDLELVDVEGVPSWVGDAKDDPHESSLFDDDDYAHYSDMGYNFTAFSHFIDIQKGRGDYDDFDGFSYARGSGKRDETQALRNAEINTSGFSGWLLNVLSNNSSIGDWPIDSAFSWWYNDEYVHAPGTQWYDHCSPALERYCNSPSTECPDRFPQTTGSTGEDGKGFPFSVFPPVDNLGRYWFDKYALTRDPRAAGFLLHAIQDCSIPHHVTSHLGNWHGEYEGQLSSVLPDYVFSQPFIEEILDLIRTWFQSTSAVVSLSPSDYVRVPNPGWPVDLLITWVALNTYKAYADVYNRFTEGFVFNRPNAYELTKYAVAMGVFLLAKAHRVVPPSNWVWDMPYLQIDPHVLDFGGVWTGSRKATLTNIGAQPLTIQSIGSPFGSTFTIVSQLPQLPIVLNSQQSIDIEIAFDRSKAVEDPERPLTIIVNGIVRPVNTGQFQDKLAILKQAMKALCNFDDHITIVSDCAQSPRDYLYLHANEMVSVYVEPFDRFPWERVWWKRITKPIPPEIPRARFPINIGRKMPPPRQVRFSDLAKLFLDRHYSYRMPPDEIKLAKARWKVFANLHAKGLGDRHQRPSRQAKSKN